MFSTGGCHQLVPVPVVATTGSKAYSFRTGLCHPPILKSIFRIYNSSEILVPVGDTKLVLISYWRHLLWHAPSLPPRLFTPSISTPLLLRPPISSPPSTMEALFYRLAAASLKDHLAVVRSMHSHHLKIRRQLRDSASSERILVPSNFC